MKKTTVMVRILVVAVLGWMALGPAAAETAPPAARPKLRLFILAGQSNMVGLDERQSFTPTIKQAFPGDEVLVVKSAAGGTPIRMWYQDWQAPAGTNAATAAGLGPPGVLYAKLLAKVRQALAGRTPDTVSFVWMQGERDAKAGWAAAYEDGLRGLIRQVRADMQHPDATVVIGRLSDHLNGQPGWDAVRAIQEKVAAGDPRAAWVDTDALNGPHNDLHYTKAGCVELGRLFAEQTIALLKK